MPNSVDISFVLVHFNGLQLTKGCIESIMQFGKSVRHEVIVVDNASTDGSAARLERHYKRQIRLVLNEVNRGYAAACNRGLALAKGHFVIILNNDLVFVKPCFDLVKKWFSTHPDMGMLGFQLINPDGTLQQSHFHFPTIPRRIFQILFKTAPRKTRRKAHVSVDALIDVDYVKGAMMVFPLRLLQKHRLRFDERYFLYHEELDFAYRLKRLGIRRMMSPLPVAVHLGNHHESPDNPAILGLRNENILRFVGTHHSRLYAKAFAMVQASMYGLKWLCGLWFEGRDVSIFQSVIKTNLNAVWNYGPFL
jgi:GT2 family glycosyltransferase